MKLKLGIIISCVGTLMFGSQDSNKQPIALFKSLAHHDAAYPTNRDITVSDVINKLQRDAQTPTILGRVSGRILKAYEEKNVTLLGKMTEISGIDLQFQQIILINDLLDEQDDDKEDEGRAVIISPMSMVRQSPFFRAHMTGTPVSMQSPSPSLSVSNGRESSTRETPMSTTPILPEIHEDEFADQE